MKLHDMHFNHDTHRWFYNGMLKRSRRKNSKYHRALFYLLGIRKETRNNIEELYNFKSGEIRVSGLFAEWQNERTLRLTLLAFHLFGGYTNKKLSYLISPHELFCSAGIAQFVTCALQLRYPELSGE